MPPLMHFYPGLTPQTFWQLRVDEVNDLITYMNKVNEQQKPKTKGKR